MQFRPCIDIHNGKVKQIVGSTLRDEEDKARDNYVAKQDAVYYAKLYKKYHLRGGHIILLNPRNSQYYELDVAQAKAALEACPDFLQIGGGIREDNAAMWLASGASHVIVTSYIFEGGCIHMERLKKMGRSIGKKHLVLDMSCRKKDGKYYIVTDRWQKFTETVVSVDTLEEMSAYCSELLIHAVDVEGKSGGVDRDLLEILASCTMVPVTYAGGIHSWEDIRLIEQLGAGYVNFTIGSSLDLFGGNLPFTEIAKAYPAS